MSSPKKLYDALPLILEMIPILASSIEDQAERNFDKWQILDISFWPNPMEVINANSFAAQVTYVENYLSLRGDWIFVTVYEDNFRDGIFD